MALGEAAAIAQLAIREHLREQARNDLIKLDSPHRVHLLLTRADITVCT
jgi:hypothetical protein